MARNDVGVAFVLLISAAMLCIPAFAGPTCRSAGRAAICSLDADEFAAAAVTAAAIAALSRVGALVVGGSIPVIMALWCCCIAIRDPIDAGGLASRAGCRRHV